MIYIQCRDSGVPWFDTCFRVYEECVEQQIDFQLLTPSGFAETEFGQEDIFVGDIDFTTAFIRQVLNPDFELLDCYPEALRPFFGRQIRLVSAESFRQEGRRLFVKPKDPKIFNGGVQTFSDIEPYIRGEDPIRTLCYVCEPLDILSEYRCFVHRGELVGVQHCSGDFAAYPDTSEVRSWISEYRSPPAAYCIDVGILQQRQIVVEVNDILCCGTYGFDANVLQLHRDRFEEISGRGGLHSPLGRE